MTAIVVLAIIVGAIRRRFPLASRQRKRLTGQNQVIP
jgi:hypothetical protein